MDFCVREAVPADNAALLALDRQCVVAATTPLMFDRSPDFFARSRPYANWRAYVAETPAGLIGVASMALKTVMVGGKPVPAAYFYDLRVAPSFRRMGVAKAVGDAIRAHARSLSPAVAYSLVMEGNVPSLAFVQDRGSRPLRSCALDLIPIETFPPANPVTPRVLDAAGAWAVLDLSRAAHRGLDLFPFPDAAALLDRIERLKGVGFRGLYGWESDGMPAGCFGLWDYSPVMRMRVLQATGEWSWAGGRDLHLVFLVPLGFQGPEGIAPAVRLAVAILRGDTEIGAACVLAIPHDVADPAYTALDVFRPIRMGFTLFGVDIRGSGEPAIGARPAFVDPADL
ncbi:MAG TPA: GNAT family N-acetyltransferase [Candidatus Methylomirabilis sp.]|nr:GNAT family N-acetyltransferase [Candidatus Methylomirabilis sp.]